MAKSKWEHVKNKLVLIEGWARDGLIDEQIANNLGISVDTFYKYKKKYPEFSEALKKGKEVSDYEVENALFKKATGYIIKLNKQKVTKDGDIINITEEMYMQPDTTAQIFWLKNRRPDKWRDKVELNNENEKTLEKLDEVLKNIGGVV